MVCDLADLDSVRAFAASMNFGRIDALMLNAGLALNAAEKEPSYTKQGFELTFGTNHLGHFLLYQLLIDSVATPGRVVVTGSAAHDPESGGGKLGSKATLGDLSGLA